MCELFKPHNHLKLLSFSPLTCKETEAESSNLLKVTQVGSGRTGLVTLSYYRKQPPGEWNKACRLVLCERLMGPTRVL